MEFAPIVTIRPVAGACEFLAALFAITRGERSICYHPTGVVNAPMELYLSSDRFVNDKLLALSLATLLLCGSLSEAATGNGSAKGDFNEDGQTNGTDLEIWKIDFGTASLDGDTDADRDSDGRDFLNWQLNYSASTGSITPEPSTIAMTLPIVIYLIAGRQKRAVAHRHDTAHTPPKPSKRRPFLAKRKLRTPFMMKIKRRRKYAHSK